MKSPITGSHHSTWLPWQTLLSWWLRPAVLPDPPPIAIDETRPVCYVLENHQPIDRRVLEQICGEFGLPSPRAPLNPADPVLRRSVTALHRPPGWLHRGRLHRSKLLERLIEVGRRSGGRRADLPELLLVPVQVFWGRAPGREDSWLRLLAAERWVALGPLRRALQVLVYGRDVWVRFGQPVSLHEFLASAPPEPERAIRKLRRLLRVYFRQQRAALLGPELLHRSAMVEQLLRQPPMRRAIQQTAHDLDIPQLRASARARRYAREIAADFSYPFALFMRRRLRRLWERLYDGIEVHGIEPLTALARSHNLVYLPCHRSHIDYLLLSYLLHEHGLAVPHIAAGINLKLPLIGALLRRGGAFYLRRSFRGNMLYASVLQTYMALLLHRGVPLEYFIEGGRSRTGLTLTPRLGLLDMTLRGFLDYPERPLALVPVYIGYEKLIEGRSHLAELAGTPKRRESLGGLLHGLRALRGHFGRVHVGFGEPLILPDRFDRHQPDWRRLPREPGERPDWLPPLTAELGREVATRINAAAAVTPVHLLATVLLANPQQTLEEDTLIDLMVRVHALLQTLPRGNPVTLTSSPGPDAVERTLRLGLVERRPGVSGPVIGVTATQAGLLDYFRNNVVHVFALPGMLADVLLKSCPTDEVGLMHHCRQTYPLLREALFLPWSEPEMEREVMVILGQWRNQRLIREDNAQYYPPAGTERTLLALLATTMQPFLTESNHSESTGRETRSPSISA